MKVRPEPYSCKRRAILGGGKSTERLTVGKTGQNLTCKTPERIFKTAPTGTGTKFYFSGHRQSVVPKNQFIPRNQAGGGLHPLADSDRKGEVPATASAQRFARTSFMQGILLVLMMLAATGMARGS